MIRSDVERWLAHPITREFKKHLELYRNDLLMFLTDGRVLAAPEIIVSEVAKTIGQITAIDHITKNVPKNMITEED